MLAEAFLPLADAKMQCRIVGDEFDGLLATYRAAAIAEIEGITRRRILDVEGVEINGSVLQEFKVIEFQVYDAQIPSTGMEIEYRSESATPGYDYDRRIEFPRTAIEAKLDTVRMKYEDLPEPRDRTVPYRAFFAVGMTAPPPPDMAVAAAFIVRELFEGSSMDRVVMGGVVQNLLSRHMPPAETAADVRRRLAEKRQREEARI